MISITPPFLRKHLQGRRVLQRTIHSTAWMIGDKLMRLGVGLVVTVWVARYLGPRGFGLLNFAVAFVALFSTFSNLGIQGFLVRELVNHPNRRDGLLGSALLLRLLGSFLAIAGSFIAIELLRPSDEESRNIVVIVALTLLPQAWDVIEYAYQAEINSRPIVLIRGLSFLVCSSAKFYLINTKGSLAAFAWLTTAEIVLSTILMNVLASRQRRLPRISSATWVELKYLTRNCWPLLVSALSVILYWRIDQVMLGQMIGDAGVGVFSAAVRISEVWYFIPMTILTSVAPALTAIYSKSRHQYLKQLLKTMRFLVLLSVIVALLLTVFSTFIIKTLYGTSYAEAATILAIHAWAGTFVVMGLAATGYFINCGLLNYSMIQTVMGALTNIALNIVLIPKYGGAGAAIATVVSQFVACVLLNALFTKCRELFQLQIQSYIPNYWAK